MDDTQSLTALEVMENVSSYELMQALSFDELFTYSFVNVYLRELEIRKKYEARVYKCDDENSQLETTVLEAHDEEEGRNLRKMFKNPQSTIACVINHRKYIEDPWIGELVVHYISGDYAKGIMEFTKNIIQRAIDYGRFSTLSEVSKFVRDYESMIEREAEKRQRAAELAKRFGKI